MYILYKKTNMEFNKNNEARRESQTSYLSDTSNIFRKYIPLESYHIENVHNNEEDPEDYNELKKSRVIKYKLIGIFLTLCIIFSLIVLHIISKPNFPHYSVKTNTNINLSGKDLLKFFDDKIYAGIDRNSYYDSFTGYIDDVSRRLDISQAELLTRDVTVLQYVHSHNDYWRKLPFFDAIIHGVNSIEADIWLMNNNENILAVGHNYDYLKPDSRNLNTLYLNPIKKILDQVNQNNNDEKLNGLFFDSPEVPTVLYIDFKNDETKNLHAYDELIKQLRPLRRYLTTQLDFDKNQYKPLIIELTGNYPQLSNYEDFLFVDSSMINVFQKTVQLKSPVISESLNKLIGFCKSDENMTLENIGTLDSDDIQICLKAIINQLHDQNYKVRIWDVPQFPVYKRNILWKQQIDDLNVDFLNVDDLDSISNF